MMPSDAIEERRSGTDRRAVPRATERRGPGRPPLTEGEDPPILHVKVPEAMYADVCRLANRDRTYNGNLSMVVRRALELLLRDERGASVIL